MQRHMLTQLRGAPKPPRQQAVRVSGWQRTIQSEPEPYNPTANGENTAFQTESRFRAGALKPIEDESSRERREGKRQWRVFDKALLTAEVLSAIVVTWLVAQYIYTAYIDTTPHRTGPGRGNPMTALSTSVTRTATRTGTPFRATSTPTTVPTPTQTAIPDRARGDGRSDVEVSPVFAAETTFTATPEATNTPTPTLTPTVDPELLLPTRLRIPVMFLDSPVHEVHVNMGTWEVDPMDVGHNEGSANPGETGNVVLAAHRDINSALFRDLDRLEPGDKVYVSNSLREYRYIVSESFVVTPSHTEVMDPTDDKRVTLITCTPIGLATQRLIVTATLDETYGQEQTQGNP